jgi:hypothetical protein
MKELTILIGTCDAYLEYLPNCVKLVDRYFEPIVKKVIVGETITQNYQGCKFLTPEKKEWGYRILHGLDKIDTEYVFFMLEDYYLSQTLSKEYFSWLLQFMNRECANKLMLSTVPDFANYQYVRTIDNIKQMRSDSNWLASIQPSIWKTEHLRKLMKPEYSPWDFEIIVSDLLKNKEYDHYVIKLDEPIYFNFVRKGGVKSEGWRQFLNEQGLEL